MALWLEEGTVYRNHVGVHEERPGDDGYAVELLGFCEKLERRLKVTRVRSS